MAKYSIEDTTLIALGDAVRGKTGIETREEYVPYEENTAIFSINTGEIDLSNHPTTDIFGNPIHTYSYEKEVTFPGASKIKVCVSASVHNEADTCGIRNGQDWVGMINTPTGSLEKIVNNTDTIKITISFNKDFYEMGKYSTFDFEIYALDSNGNLLTEVLTEVKNTMTPMQMAEAINNLEMTSDPVIEELNITKNGTYTAPEGVNGYSPVIVNVAGGGGDLSEEALTVTGNCSYRFANNGWNWFIDDYGNQIQTKDITNADYMFQKSTLEHIPFEINLISTGSSNNMFESCEALKKAPIVNNLAPGTRIFKDCKKMTSLNNIKLRNTPNNFYCDSMFGTCYSLRSIGGFFDNVSDTVAGASIYGMYNVFENCRTLDELVNLPYIYSTYSSSSYSFGNFVTYNCRLKELTFRDGIVLTSGPKGGASLNVSTYVGYSNVDLVQYGMSADKKVTDDTSYQALKDDPDWWTMDVNYSRYNHDSAVNTINSLPDLSGMSYTNTITFKGASGALTDGGAISNLTEEEIAVATAKGWTVKIV